MSVLKNLENKIKLAAILSTVSIVSSAVVSIFSFIIARGEVADAYKNIYVLDGNLPVLVHQTDMEVTNAIEAKADIEAFHHLFFTLSPDDKYIEYTMKKAMYLIDETGLAQYNSLKEKGFYSNLVGTSTICSIFCDSIQLDEKALKFVYYRQLVTAGNLRRVPRSENNPYGFLISNWRTLKNADLEERQKSNY